PGSRTADQDGPRDPPQGGHQGHRPGLRGGRPLARRPDAQERRPVHHPPARGDDHPRRTWHEHLYALRRAAARHGGAHRLHPLPERRTKSGDEVDMRVDGVTKLDRVKYGEAAEAETVSKMVVAMSRDIRVLVIKLADRLHNMRTLRYLAREKQERKSREVLEIYAPLAHRLGTNPTKWELEDLAFATLYPKRYDEIARMVSERAPERELFLQDVIEQVRADLHEAKIKEKVTGRPKHYYSVYQKMIARNV